MQLPGLAQASEHTSMLASACEQSSSMQSRHKTCPGSCMHLGSCSSICGCLVSFLKFASVVSDQCVAASMALMGEYHVQHVAALAAFKR